MYRTLTLSYLITHSKIHFNPRLFTEHKSYLQYKKFSKIFGQKSFLLPNMFYNFSLDLLKNCHLQKMSLLVFKCLKLDIAKVFFSTLASALLFTSVENELSLQP